MRILSRKDIKKLERLKKRLSWLEERIRTSDKDLSYDRSEASALRWAINLIEELTTH